MSQARVRDTRAPTQIQRLQRKGGEVSQARVRDAMTARDGDPLVLSRLLHHGIHQGFGLHVRLDGCPNHQVQRPESWVVKERVQVSANCPQGEKVVH